MGLFNKADKASTEALSKRGESHLAPRTFNMTIGGLEKALLKEFPAEDAEKWDRTGLLVGERSLPVSRVAVALDATPGAVAVAAEAGANVLLTHHPAFLEAPDAFAPEASALESPGAVVWAAFRTAGVAAGLGKRLDWPDPYFTFYAEASYERYMLKDWNTFVLKNGAANLLSIRLVLGRNSVDQPIYPRRGSDFSVSVQLTPPYSLWDGKDYKSTALSEQERYNWIEFHKWMLKGQWFTPLTRNGNLVLMARAEMGYLGHYNKNKVSPFERFEVGGDGMTGYNMYGIDIISMRGYDDGALDPVGSNYSCAYNKYTMELRYPLLLKGQTNIYVLGFLEGGNGFTSWKEFSPFKIKRSAGIGVRLFLPVVGMVGVDWGWGFDPAAGQTKRSGSHIHFTMGMQF